MQTNHLSEIEVVLFALTRILQQLKLFFVFSLDYHLVTIAKTIAI
jgi:hypothetical protein